MAGRKAWLVRRGIGLVVLGLGLLAGGCGGDDEPPATSPVVIHYWEKWNGFEGDAIRAVVDDFNRSQDRIHVELLSVSQIQRKVMLATAGGNPPDVAGLFSTEIPIYAENNALTPLDPYIEQYGLNRGDYIPIFWDINEHRGIMWSLPSMPMTTALHWNKKMFREAGLDPDRPPRTLKELEAFNEKLLRRDGNGRIVQIGHSPAEPGWWRYFWPIWFGGSLVGADGEITADAPANLEAGEWLASYPERFGAQELLAMREGFGTFASPQNPFFTGRVAMVLQGPWMYNFIRNFAPEDFEWGVAPFPCAEDAPLAYRTNAEADVLCIPAGAPHPEEAFEFIAYVQQRGPMEKLALGQRKYSPLRETSPGFFENHPTPYIEIFYDLAESPYVTTPPRVTVWREYSEELNQAVDAILMGRQTPEEAYGEAQRRIARMWERKEHRWERVAEARLEEWGVAP